MTVEGADLVVSILHRQLANGEQILMDTGSLCWHRFFDSSFEIIVHDDAPTDASPEILSRRPQSSGHSE